MVSKAENGLMQVYVKQWKLMKERSLESSKLHIQVIHYSNTPPSVNDGTILKAEIVLFKP